MDFGEFHAAIAGSLLKLWLFVLRLSCSGRAFHVAFATQVHEAFLEGQRLLEARVDNRAPCLRAADCRRREASVTDPT